MIHICGIVVTYEPNLTVLNKLIASIQFQVDSLVVVDNGSQLNVVLSADFCALLKNPVNVGLAAAQNQGINWAIAMNATHVLIFDQDSEPERDMVQKLHNAEKQLLIRGCEVAAVGPTCVDKVSNEPNPFYKLNGFRYEKKYTPDFECFVETIFLISSGQLIRTPVLHLIGLMREDLFIDYIDVEWGLRASGLGYKSYGVTSTKMFHSVGDKSISINEISFPVHAPLRYYYMTRNAVILYLTFKFPIKWIVADLLVSLRRMVVAVTFCKPRRANAMNILLGFFHGICGRAGSKQKKSSGTQTEI